MRITKETIDRIYAATDIVEVVGDFVSLKKRGANYAALSPFTNEKSPSFYVSPSKQIFKCFSTGKGGDAVKFLMEIDKLSYAEALKYLAKKYGIEVQYDREVTDEEQQQQSERDALFIVLNYAKDFYKNILYNDPNGQAIGLSYFKERGLNEKTINDFELGFSPEGWDNLLKDAEKHQYSLELLEKAGLIKISENNGKKFDFFRNRVMYPIHNMTGKVIALAGRILTNEKGTAKYINSPETELYHKSQVLYGMFQARQTIRNEDNCLLVEGYMDVLSLYQAGITNAVASSGTSLTEEQVKLISRYTKNVTVLYDGDKAGINAAIRGTDLILDSGLNIKVLVFPDGHDPDSYVNQVGETAFREYMKASAKDFITFKTEVLLKDASDDPIKKASVIREVVNSIAKVKDNIQRSLYFKRCSQLLGIDEQVIITEYNKIQLEQRKKASGSKDEAQTIEALKPEEEAPPQPHFEEVHPDEIAEKEIVRVLLEYAQFNLEEQTPLYQFVFSYLQNIELKNPFVSRIVLIFQEELMNGNVPGLDYFLNHPEKDIEQFLAELLTDRHDLSELWANKHMIYVPEKDSEISHLVHKSIARLNFEKTIRIDKEVLLKLKSVHNDNIEEIETILQTREVLKTYLKQYAVEMGYTVVNGHL